MYFDLMLESFFRGGGRVGVEKSIALVWFIFAERSQFEGKGYVKETPKNGVA